MAELVYREVYPMNPAEVKDILDKGALGTEITTHLSRQRLPRDPWTACDGRTRLRFLAYSRHNNRPHGLVSLILALHS